MLSWLVERTAKSPNETALVYKGRSWTFAELNNQAADMAARLAAAGIQPGDHVAALMPNRPEYVRLVFALMRMGCVVVPINIRLTTVEIARLLARADCQTVICSAETEAAAADLPETLRVICVDKAANSGLVSLGNLKPVNPDFWKTGRPVTRDAVLAIIYTSGTTGSPKGAMLTFDNFLASAIASRRRLGRHTAARWLLCMPLYHVGGLSIVLRCCLYGTTVVLHDSFEVDAVAEALERDGVTLVSLVPTMLHRLIEKRGGRTFPSSLKCILLGGAAASPLLVHECVHLGLPVSTTYGLTESASQAATATIDEVVANPGLVGRALPGTRLRVVGGDGAELPAGEIGEVLVSGRTIMKGYYDDPEATGRALREGWLHTGDLGSLDEAGSLRVVQRRDDLIVTGGENVYPAEVEAVLETHAMVREVCVVGVDDLEWGQVVAALVVSKTSQTDSDTLLTYCRARLAGYKCPRIIRFVESLPRTASGKLQRQEAARLLDPRRSDAEGQLAAR